MSKPVIGVTGAKRRAVQLWWFAALSLRLQGARPVKIVPPLRPERLERLDGLLIGGGDDIGADLYGGMPVPDVRIDPERDELEHAALEHFWPTGIPIMGICRGSQMMNVFMGGTLHQDIYKVYTDAKRMRTPLPRKCVELGEDSELREIIGQPTITVNSLHHQSVDRPGEGMRIAAKDEQGIVQAVEMPGPRFRIGVQWHPEFLFYRRGHRRLFRAFGEAARVQKMTAGSRVASSGQDQSSAMPTS
ncbi:MAG: gamma-glutamyl-gamma-aminobutyrate hydrolase family protein [Geminicoccaceae bacterium]